MSKRVEPNHVIFKSEYVRMLASLLVDSKINKIIESLNRYLEETIGHIPTTNKLVVNELTVNELMVNGPMVNESTSIVSKNAISKNMMEEMNKLLICACYCNAVPLIKYLLNTVGTNCETLSVKHTTPIMYLARNDNLEMVKYFATLVNPLKKYGVGEKAYDAIKFSPQDSATYVYLIKLQTDARITELERKIAENVVTVAEKDTMIVEKDIRIAELEIRTRIDAEIIVSEIISGNLEYTGIANFRSIVNIKENRIVKLENVIAKLENDICDHRIDLITRDEKIAEKDNIINQLEKNIYKSITALEKRHG
jgi:hypothetical protein